MNTIQISDVGVGPKPYTAEQFDAELATASANEPLIVEIHSNGGDVTEGFKIYSRLKAWEGRKIAKVQVKAFSIASYIAMACDEIEIAENGYFMIHRPRTTLENADDTKLTSQADFVKDIRAKMVAAYAERSSLDEAQIEDMMRDETFISASQAISIGMADRIIGRVDVEPEPEVTNHLPSLVFASMYGPQSDGSPSAETPQENSEMSNTQTPVAASVQSIKAAYPKASNEFIVKCMEKEMAMKDVGEEYAKAMEMENEDLKAKVSAMEQELADLKAESTDTVEPTATAHGAEPVVDAPAESSGGNPQAEFQALVESNVAKGMTRTKAVIAANRQNPTLREQVVAQANSRVG